MYLNHLCTDRELIDAAQYAENPHLRLLAERLDDKLQIIEKAKVKLLDVRHNALNPGIQHRSDELKDILES